MKIPWKQWDSRPKLEKSARYMTKFLETAIDFVTAAATATGLTGALGAVSPAGMGAESPETRAEEAVDSAVRAPISHSLSFLIHSCIYV